jgi:glycosyltransferase involved in cell wall biosynthesis
MTKAIRILIYTRAFPPMVGGIETITMELARKLCATSGLSSLQNVQVTVVTPKPAAAPNEGSLPFKIVRNPNLPRLARLILQADIFHIAGADMLPLFLGWFLRKPIVVGHHTFQSVCPNGQMFYEPTQTFCSSHFMSGSHRACLSCNRDAAGALRGLKRWLLTFPRRWLCLQARAHIVPTTWFGAQLQLPRTTTIHHGLPAKAFIASVSSTPPQIVFLGRLVRTKGVHVLLQAVQQLANCDFALEIVGDGPERERLQAQVRSLGIESRAHFRGYLPEAELDALLARAKAVVMPSLAGEAFGLVALENMLRQKLVIVSDIGALTEVVGDAGLSFPSGDSRALAACLRRVLQSDDLAQQLAARARLRAESLFSTERMVHDHLELYLQAVGASAAPELAFDSARASAPMSKDPRPSSL